MRVVIFFIFFLNNYSAHWVFASILSSELDSNVSPLPCAPDTVVVVFIVSADNPWRVHRGVDTPLCKQTPTELTANLSTQRSGVTTEVSRSCARVTRVLTDLSLSQSASSPCFNTTGGIDYRKCRYTVEYAVWCESRPSSRCGCIGNIDLLCRVLLQSLTRSI